jgi:hypothetical protein
VTARDQELAHLGRTLLSIELHVEVLEMAIRGCANIEAHDVEALGVLLTALVRLAREGKRQVAATEVLS